MKGINTYISEKLHINKNVKDPYNYHPKTKDELIECIEDKIEKEGLGTEKNLLDLNDIDTSEITDMSHLFDSLNGKLKDLSINGNFDISDWDVSNVENMTYMFYSSIFDGNISDWDVSKVENMYGMFAQSAFDGDISDWDVSNVKYMGFMFNNSKFTGKNGNISNWKVNKVKNMAYMFESSPLEKNPPKWYKNEIN